MALLSTALHNGLFHIFYLEWFCQMCGHAGCETSFASSSNAFAVMARIGTVFASALSIARMALLLRYHP